MAGAQGALPRYRAAPDRPAADQQGARGGGAVRRDRDRRPAPLAGRWPRKWRRAGQAPRLFVQVNTGEEPQKAGVLPQEADAFVALCRDEFGLAIEG